MRNKAKAFAAVLASVFAALSLAGAQTASAAPQTANEWAPAVCFVSSPSGANSFGHMGWAVRDETNRWAVGATEGSGAGEYREAFDITDAQFHDFFRARSNYETYRCRNSDSGVGNAWATWNAAKNRSYNLVNDNCLTRSIEVINQMGLGLPSGAGSIPNSYYDRVLTDWGFGPREPV